MICLNFASKEPCPKCGGDMRECFDGGNDRLSERCDRERLILRGPALRAWWAEHDKTCPGDGKCRARPPSWRCDVEFSPPRWLTKALALEAVSE